MHPLSLPLQCSHSLTEVFFKDGQIPQHSNWVPTSTMWGRKRACQVFPNTPNMVSMLCGHRQRCIKGFPTWFRTNQFQTSIQHSTPYQESLVWEYFIPKDNIASFLHLIQLSTWCLKWSLCPCVYKVEDRFWKVQRLGLEGKPTESFCFQAQKSPQLIWCQKLTSAQLGVNTQ